MDLLTSKLFDNNINNVSYQIDRYIASRSVLMEPRVLLECDKFDGNVVRRLIFLVWNYIGSLKILDLMPTLKVPPGGLVLGPEYLYRSQVDLNLHTRAPKNFYRQVQIL